jgi:hypothetical protein
LNQYALEQRPELGRWFVALLQRMARRRQQIGAAIIQPSPFPHRSLIADFPPRVNRT